MSNNDNYYISYIELLNDENKEINIIKKYNEFDKNQIEEDLYTFFMNYSGEKYGDLIKQIADKYYNENKTMEYIRDDTNIDEGIFILKNIHDCDNGCHIIFEIYQKKELELPKKWFSNVINISTEFKKIGNLSYLDVSKFDNIISEFYTFTLCLFENLHPNENMLKIKKLCDEVKDLNDIKKNSHMKFGPYLIKDCDKYIIQHKTKVDEQVGWIYNTPSIIKMLKSHYIYDSFYNRQFKIEPSNLFNTDKQIIRALLKLLTEKRVENKLNLIYLKTIVNNLDPVLVNKFDKNISILNNKTLSSNTIYLWAEEDDFVEYNKLMAMIIKRYLENYSDDNIFEIINILFRHKLISIKENFGKNSISDDWLFYENKFWVSKNNIQIRELIVKALKNLQIIYKCDEVINKANNILINIKFIINKLDNKEFFNNILDEIFKKVNKKNITNNKYICFNNGVYDINHKSFRSNIYEDFNKKSIGYDWISYEDKELKNFNTFLENLCGTEDNKNYILKLLGDFLIGENRNINIWYFQSEITKKLVMSFLEGFGNYKSSKIICNKSNDAFDISNSNFLYMDIQSDNIEEIETLITGYNICVTNNTFKTKLLFLTNKMLKLNHKDSIWNNLRIFPWTTELVTFEECANSGKNLNQNEMLYDGDIVESMKNKRSIFISLIIKNYERIHSYDDPYIVEETKKNWIKYNDPLYLFEKGFLIPDNSLNSKVSLDKCYNLFVIFNESNEKIDKNVFSEYLEYDGYFIDNGFIYGISLLE